MDPTDSEVIEAPGKESMPFWPSGRKRLRLNFTTLGDTVTVSGCVPDDVDPNSPVFEQQLRPDQRSAFREAVILGVAGELIPTAGIGAASRLMVNGTVVITTDSGDGSGPKAYRVKLEAAAVSPAGAEPQGPRARFIACLRRMVGLSPRARSSVMLDDALDSKPGT